MSDKIKKYLAYNQKVLITVIESTELVEEARKIHDLTPTTTAALGRLLTAVALMGVELKNENDSISAQIKGNGPIGSMIAVSDKTPKVRAYIQNPHIELSLNEQGKIDVGGAVGKQGYLNIIKDIGLKEPYIGIVPLTSGEIAEDFARYFVESEQKNSAVSLGVLVNKEGVLRAGGYSIALMPDATDEIATKLEENIKNMPSISKMLDKNANLDEIAQQITGDSKLETIEENIKPKYECNCSSEKFEKGLISLGKTELEELIKTEQSIETVCSFCNKKYIFDKQKIEELIKEM
ncbi:MAG: Hsp33 family molecular chaperone HslO [Clostridia bacterium]|jgi:molecular chaperone Hsp33|nr:Hsp33 family molecular chaperone HslO [Clostridia bacterium]